MMPGYVLITLFQLTHAGCGQARTEQTLDVPPVESTLRGPYVTASARIPRVRVSNRRCPVDNAELPGGPQVLELLSRKHQNRTLGFCSDRCATMWDAMTESTRDGVIARTR